MMQPDIEIIRALNALRHPDDNPSPTPDRNAVEAVLGRLAAGRTDTEDLMFMQELARCLLAAGGKGAPAERRADAVLSGAGLSGKYDYGLAFVERATALEGFDGWNKADAIRNARNEGALHESVDDTTARKRLDKLR